MELSIIVPFFNGHKTIQRLINSIPAGLQILVIDDQSDVPYKSNNPNVTVFRMPKKGYFTGACNTGILQTTGDVLILNQDTYFENQSWQGLIIKNQEQYAMIGENISGYHPAYPKGYIHGTFMFLRRDLINKVGLMDEATYPLWGSTCEYQLRAARAGFAVLPQDHIPGFVHTREGNIGASIQTILKREPERQSIFIRTPPEISVVVSCFNYGRYLPDLVASLIGGKSSLGVLPPQSFQSFEVIIVDDASTDNSLEIAQSLADPYKGIRVISRKKNGGTAAANNTGISQSYGKYITVICADDMREYWSLSDLYYTQLKNPHSMIYDGILPFARGARRPDIRIGVGEYNFDRLLLKNHIHAGIMFPKQAWIDINGYPEEFSDGREDWAVNVALGIKGYCGVYINPDKPGYLYRREGHNRTLKNTNPVNHALFLQKLKRRFPEIYKGARPMGCCGGTKSVSKSSTLANKKAIVAGGEGTILLEYLGNNWGNSAYYGPATGARYYAGKNMRVIPVDIRDLTTSVNKQSGLLEIKENGKLVFKRYTPPPVTAPAPSVKSMPAVDPVKAEVNEEAEGEVIEEMVVTAMPEAKEETQKVLEIPAEEIELEAEEIKPAKRGRKKKDADQ